MNWFSKLAFVKYLFAFNLVMFDLEHTNAELMHVCVYEEGAALGIHLETKGGPSWKNLGTTFLCSCRNECRPGAYDVSNADICKCIFFVCMCIHVFVSLYVSVYVYV